jgi:hypothetical protein
MEKQILPRKCLTSCEVPYLCVIACPLNERLEDFAPQPTNADDVPSEIDAAMDVIIVDEKDSPLPQQPKP